MGKHSPENRKKWQQEYYRREVERKKREGECLKCREPAVEGITLCAIHREEHRSRSAGRRARYREMVFDHYGRVCSCCGEDEPMFLHLDHVNNDGYQDRKRGNPSTHYQRVVEDGFPDTFQVLCANCNQGKHRNGGVCPHKTR